MHKKTWHERRAGPSNSHGGLGFSRNFDACMNFVTRLKTQYVFGLREFWMFRLDCNHLAVPQSFRHTVREARNVRSI